MSKLQCRVESVKLRDVVPMVDNPRQIDERSLNGLRASMSRFGYVEPIVWNEQTGHIVGGHQRFAVLQKEGVKEAKMVVVDMSPEEEMAANLTLNNPEIEGQWDDTAIGLVKQIGDGNPELFESLNMDVLLRALEAEQPAPPPPSPDTPPEPPKVEWDTECPCCQNKWKIEVKDIIVMENK